MVPFDTDTAYQIIGTAMRADLAFISNAKLQAN